MSDTDREFCATLTHQAALLVWAHELGKSKSKSQLVARLRDDLVKLENLTWGTDERSRRRAQFEWFRAARIYNNGNYWLMEQAASCVAAALFALKGPTGEEAAEIVELDLVDVAEAKRDAGGVKSVYAAAFAFAESKAARRDQVGHTLMLLTSQPGDERSMQHILDAWEAGGISAAMD